jgi:hypothetical protein
MQRALKRSLSLAYFNLSVVDVRQQLVEVAHVEPFSAARALHEMIGLGFGDAVRIEVGIVRGHKSSLMPYEERMMADRPRPYLTRAVVTLKTARRSATYS